MIEIHSNVKGGCFESPYSVGEWLTSSGDIIKTDFKLTLNDGFEHLEGWAKAALSGEACAVQGDDGESVAWKPRLELDCSSGYWDVKIKYITNAMQEGLPIQLCDKATYNTAGRAYKQTHKSFVIASYDSYLWINAPESKYITVEDIFGDGDYKRKPSISMYGMRISDNPLSWDKENIVGYVEWVVPSGYTVDGAMAGLGGRWRLFPIKGWEEPKINLQGSKKFFSTLAAASSIAESEKLSCTPLDN